MSDFQPGDLVVCVDAKPYPRWTIYLGDPGYTRPLVEGRHYRVESVLIYWDGTPLIRLVGIVTNYQREPGLQGFWPHDRFRKLNDEPDDIALIERIKRPQPAKETANVVHKETVR